MIRPYENKSRYAALSVLLCPFYGLVVLAWPCPDSAMSLPVLWLDYIQR